MVVNVYATSGTIQPCSRNELLAFVNNFLAANLTRIEEMSTGAAYCQLTEILFPGKISLKKVKWNTRKETDWIANWNILQKAWKDIGVQKAVPVERLLRAKFQDNFEFLQWFKKFFDANYESHPYDALAVRNGEPLPASWPIKPRLVGQRTSAAGQSVVTLAFDRKVSQRQNATEQRTIQELKESAAELAKQRDFYYDKVRRIELLCQNAENSATISRERVLDILYDTEVFANNNFTFLTNNNAESKARDTVIQTSERKSALSTCANP